MPASAGMTSTLPSAGKTLTPAWAGMTSRLPPAGLTLTPALAGLTSTPALAGMTRTGVQFPSPVPRFLFPRHFLLPAVCFLFPSSHTTLRDDRGARGTEVAR
jgi:hypothetical protein